MLNNWTVSLFFIVLATTACSDNNNNNNDTEHTDSQNTGITPTIAFGTVTDIGTVTVNGVSYDTGTATVMVDDESDAAASLRIGMVVAVEGGVNTDGVNGSASRVTYEEQLQGSVSDAPSIDPSGTVKTFTVLGTTVVADKNVTVFDDSDAFTFTTLAQNDVVEVSGYYDADGILQVTYLKKTAVYTPGISAAELLGVVNDYNGMDTFNLGNATVTIDATTDLSALSGGVQNNLVVEVEGIQTDVAAIRALRIHPQAATFQDNVSHVSIQGIVTAFNSLQDFSVNGLPVDAGMAQFTPDALQTNLMTGARVEVDGAITNGVLQAQKVLARGGDIVLQAPVSAVVTGNTVSVVPVDGEPVVAVTTNARTLLSQGEGSAPLAPSDLSAGEFVTVQAYANNSGAPVATRVERIGADNVVVRGALGTANGITGTVTILGVTFQTTAATVFEENNVAISRDTFFAQATDGASVTITDDRVAGVTDGNADIVNLTR